MGLFGKKPENERHKVLAQVHFLSRLSRHERQLFAQNLNERNYAVDEWVFHQGYPQAVMYIVVKGEVDIVIESADGEPKVVDTLAPGAFFGETGLFVESVRTAGVRARTEAVLLAVSQQDFHNFLQLNPRTGVKLLYGLGERLSTVLSRTNQQLFDCLQGQQSE